jgi:4-amino-4-deoxy-L-arabinose transferase-like glycosyltransferase
VGKPVHVDDANFLALAHGAAKDFWRPHAIQINWLGTTEKALEVLSNPPGLAWWLLPVRNSPVHVLHLWMLPWVLLSAWGSWQLGQRFTGSGFWAALLFCTTPVVVLCGHSLMPDLPLLACTLAGLGGFLRAKRHLWAWALLAGTAVLFRYSGLLVPPLVVFTAWMLRRDAIGMRASLAAFLPAIGLVFHDLHAYGQIHFLAMTGFQTGSVSIPKLALNLVSLLGALGGVGLLPILSFHRNRWRWTAAGGLIGLEAALLFGQPAIALLLTTASVAGGATALSVFRLRAPEDRVLCAWGIIGLGFLASLRFAASRYWLPFLAPFFLAALRLGVGKTRLYTALAVHICLGLMLALDDLQFAQSLPK